MCPCTRVAPHTSQKNQQFLFMQGFFFPFFNFSKLKFWKVRQWKRKIWKKISEHCTFHGKQMEEKLRGGGDEGREWKRKTWLKEKKKEFYFENWQVETKSIFSYFLKFLMKLRFCQKWNFPMRPLPLVTVKYISIGKHMYIKSRMKNKLMLELHAQGMGWVQWGAGIEKMLINLQIAPAWDRQICAGS